MSNEEKYYSFVDHLEELRYRLIYCCISILLCVVLGFFLSERVINFLLNPFEKAQKIKEQKRLIFIAEKDGSLKLKGSISDYIKEKTLSQTQFEIIDSEKPENKIVFGTEYKTQFYYFSPLTPLILQFKASFFLAILFSIPVIFYHLWKFIVPALTPSEKKAGIFIMLAAFLLFPTGAIFAYYVLRFALYFLISFSFSGLEPRIDVMKYLGFVITMMLAMGCVFEFPLAAMFLGKLGLISSKKMNNYRKYSIVLIVIFSAVITPSPDPVSMILVAIPLTILYEISIYLVRIVEKKKIASKISNLAG